MPRPNRAAREHAGHCPFCAKQLSAVPMEVGPAFVRYEYRCYGPHTEQDLAKASGDIFGHGEP